MSDYSVEEILRAKRIAKEAGYEVSLPTDRIEQAKNIARANGYEVRKADTVDPTEIAMQVARAAGFNVVQNGNGVQSSNGVKTAPTNTPAPAPNNANAEVNKNNQNTTPAPSAKPAEEDPYAGYSWSEKQAAKYL